MIGAKHQWLLWLAGALMLSASLFFGEPGFSENRNLPVNLYYTSEAMAIFLFHLFIFVNFKQYLITFLLLGLSVNKLFDELFFDPTKMQLNELFFTVAIIIFGIIRQRRIKRNSKTVANDRVCHNNCSFEIDNRKQEE